MLNAHDITKINFFSVAIISQSWEFSEGKFHL